MAYRSEEEELAALFPDTSRGSEDVLAEREIAEAQAAADAEHAREHAEYVQRYNEWLARHEEKMAAGEEDDEEPMEPPPAFALAVKPFLGAIKAPSNPPQINPNAPQKNLELQFVYGYRGKDCRKNLYYGANGHLAYFASGVGVVYDKATHTQQFFRQHTDDILCAALHPQRELIVTGQISDHSRNPFLAVWRISDPTRMVAKLEHGHQRGVLACSFNSNGTRVVSVGDDDNHSIIVWDWQRGAKLDEAKGDGNRILDIVCSPTTDDFVTVGVKHTKFWSLAGRLNGKRASFPAARPGAGAGAAAQQQTMLCAAYNSLNDVLIGAWSGEVYIFRGTALLHSLQVHQGPVYSIKADPDCIITGGKDQKLVIMDPMMKPVVSVNLTNVCPKSIDTCATSILVGTMTNDIVEIDRTTYAATRVLDTHFAELWGLATHGTLAATCGDDGTVRLWDTTSMHLVAKEWIGGIQNNGARAIAFNNAGTLLAIGTQSGTTFVVDAHTLQQVAQINRRTQQGLTKSSTPGIEEIKFSPNDQLLAIGGHDTKLFFFNTTTWREVGFTGMAMHSCVLHVDWARDSSCVVVNTQDYELLWFQPTGTQITSATSVRDMEYASWTCKLGWPVQGIWPGIDYSDVNSVARSPNGTVVATSDDFGEVKLFRWPCVQEKSRFVGSKGQGATPGGHCSHVTKVRWVNDNLLLSTGGLDASIFQWRVTP